MPPGKAHTASAAGADRISALLDEILHRILLFLPAQQATWTCVLARRWVHLWKSATGLRIVGADGDAPVCFEQVREFVDHLLLLCGSKPIEECEFRLSGFSKEDMPRMNLWIRHALVCGVRVLKLFFFRDFAHFTALQPEDPSLVSRRLTKLKLKGLVFNNKFLDFSRCPSMRKLQIVGCILAHVNKISSQSLKYLKVFASVFNRSFRTRIHAPNLVSLQLDVTAGRTPVLETMPPLLKAVIEVNHRCADRCSRNAYGDCSDGSCKDCIQNDGYCVLLQGLSQAKNLLLVAPAEMKDLKWCPTFRQLKHVVLNEHWCAPDVRALASILKHSPVLEDLCLLLFSKGPKHNVEMEGSFNPKELPSTISEHLKRVEIKCERVDETVVEVLRSLSKLNISLNFLEKKVCFEDESMSGKEGCLHL